MIFENEKQMPDSQVKKLVEEVLEKFPQFKKDGIVLLRYNDELYQDDKSNPGKKRAPKSINVPMFAQVNTENGVKSYRYVKNVLTTTKGEIKGYNPSHFMVDRQSAVTDVELLVFLYNYCPFVMESKNSNPTIERTLQIEDTRRDAAQKNEKKRLEGSYINALYNTTPLSLLKTIAKSFDITLADDDDKDIVASKIDNYLSTKPNGKLIFLERVSLNQSAPDKLNLLDKLKDAENLGIVMFDPVKKAWLLNLIGGESMVLLKTPSKNPKIESLYKHLSEDDTKTLAAIVKEVEAREQGVEHEEGEG